MQITPEQKSQMLALIEFWYPNWQGITDPRFEKNESSYKRKSAREAEENLSREALTTLLDSANYEEISLRAQTIAKHSKLLYIATPSTGDLAIWENPAFSHESFSHALFDLLYGNGTSAERLVRYTEWVEALKPPTWWQFSTLMLSLTNPSGDIMVKPRKIDRVMKWVNPSFRRPARPTADTYARIQEMGQAVIEAFSAEGAVDMIDAHSIIWTVASVDSEQKAAQKGAKTAPTKDEQPRPEKAIRETSEPLASSAGSPFSLRTFELLEGIRDNPTVQFYNAHKDEFRSEVEEPLQRVMRAAAQRIDPRIKQLMETEKRLFSRFPKNNYGKGKGAAWPWYWGAFYPKGSKRSEDAQLSVSISAQRFDYGFYIGESGSSQRARFMKNMQKHGDAIVAIMSDILPDGTVHFGEIKQVSESAGDTQARATWADFAANPEKYNCDVGHPLLPAELLALDEETLIEAIRKTHEDLFPLVLLARLDDPMQAIYQYVGQALDDDEDEVEIYEISDFLSTTSLTESEAKELRNLLEDKKRQQLLLFGPPGTGKTYVALELGKLITGLANPPKDRVELVQFHPAYAYEDFIEGIRPESKPGAHGTNVVDYPTKAGVFKAFCQRASLHDKPCVFIIDEMNRGNIARIFGELLFLLEYRDYVVTLPYSGQSFHIPKNVFIIGTMNTADRSIALVDFALRRRFHFYRFGADPELLRRWLKDNPNDEIPYLYDLYFELTDRAIPDENLRIGPSHFMQPGLTAEGLERLWKRSIEPYLEEFHFGKPRLAKDWAWDSDNVSAIRNRGGGE